MYLSNSRLQLFNYDKIGYYFKYIVGREIEDVSNKLPLHVGSNFDILLKNDMGHSGLNFKSRVGVAEAKELFTGYKSTPAMDRLLTELRHGHTGDGLAYVMEQKIYSVIDGVPFVGIPDFFRWDKRLVIDLKSSWGERSSPVAGYVWRSDTNVSHKDCLPHKLESWGVTVNLGSSMTNVDPWWMAQLTIYSWLLGNPIGEPFVAGIDHIIRLKGKGPTVVTYRFIVNAEDQRHLFRYCAWAWNKINNPETWKDMPSWEEYQSLNLGGYSKTDWREVDLDS